MSMKNNGMQSLSRLPGTLKYLKSPIYVKSLNMAIFSLTLVFLLQLSMLVQGVLYCMLEPLAASINPLNDHWVLRDYAARLLAQITR